MLTHLPHIVTLMTESRQTFSGGGYTTTWTSVSTEWANCQQDSGSSENNNYNKQQQFTAWKVTMRHNSNITNKNRLMYGSLILHIETVRDPTTRKRMMHLKCREEVI